jgi:hypothetical protein
MSTSSTFEIVQQQQQVQDLRHRKMLISLF